MTMTPKEALGYLDHAGYHAFLGNESAQEAIAVLTAAVEGSGVAVELTRCCGREECGGECGNEWRGTEWVRKQQPVAATGFDAACDMLGIGKDARNTGVVVANIRNLQLFAGQQAAIERTFFMVPGEPDDDYPDDAPEDDCLLNRWGSTPEQYVDQFRAALPKITAALQQPVVAVANVAVECQYQDTDGSWCWFHNPKHRDATIADGRWPIRYLYADPQPASGEATPAMAAAFKAAHDEHAAAKIPKVYAAGQREEANIIVGLRAAIAAATRGGADEDEDGMPVGYARWYNGYFRNQTVDTARDHNCEAAWRAGHAAAPQQPVVASVADPVRAALLRFADTTADCGQTNLPRSVLNALIAFGYLTRRRAGRYGYFYEATDAGEAMIEAAPDAPQQPVVVTDAVNERVNQYGEPEAIYLQLHGDGYRDSTGPEDYKNGEVTWCWHSINDDDVRYVRDDFGAVEQPADADARDEWPVVADIRAELVHAVRLFPTWPTDPLHAVAVFGEEAGELTKAVLQAVYEPHKSTIADVREEALQAAAMAIRFLHSLHTYEWKQGPRHEQHAALQQGKGT